MKLILARHGETVLNQQRKFYGLLDTLLDERGIAQATSLADKVEPEQPTIAVTTGLTRTNQTMQPFLQRHPTVPKIVISEFNEKGFGSWEGLDADEIEARFPTEWQLWLDQPLTYTPQGAESFARFKRRVQAGLSRLLTQMKDTDVAFVVAHLGTLRVIYQELVENQYFYDIDFQAGHYSLIKLDGQQQVALVNMNE